MVSVGCGYGYPQEADVHRTRAFFTLRAAGNWKEDPESLEDKNMIFLEPSADFYKHMHQDSERTRQRLSTTIKEVTLHLAELSKAVEKLENELRDLKISEKDASWLAQGS